MWWRAYALYPVPSTRSSTAILFNVSTVSVLSHACRFLSIIRRIVEHLHRIYTFLQMRYRFCCIARLLSSRLRTVSGFRGSKISYRSMSCTLASSTLRSLDSNWRPWCVLSHIMYTQREAYSCVIDTNTAQTVISYTWLSKSVESASTLKSTQIKKCWSSLDFRSDDFRWLQIKVCCSV